MVWLCSQLEPADPMTVILWMEEILHLGVLILILEGTGLNPCGGFKAARLLGWAGRLNQAEA